MVVAAIKQTGARAYLWVPIACNRPVWTEEKWTGWDLNPRPLPCQDSDLPADLPARGASMREPSLKPCPSRAPPSDVESRAASCTGARSRSTATPPRAGRTKSGRAIPGTLLRGQGHHRRVTGEDREVTVPPRGVVPVRPEVLLEFRKAAQDVRVLPARSDDEDLFPGIKSSQGEAPGPLRLKT